MITMIHRLFSLSLITNAFDFILTMFIARYYCLAHFSLFALPTYDLILPLLLLQLLYMFYNIEAI